MASVSLVKYGCARCMLAERQGLKRRSGSSLLYSRSLQAGDDLKIPTPFPCYVSFWTKLSSLIEHGSTIFADESTEEQDRECVLKHLSQMSCPG